MQWSAGVAVLIARLPRGRSQPNRRATLLTYDDPVQQTTTEPSPPDEASTLNEFRKGRPRAILPGFVLVAAYWCLSLLNNQNGSLGTDTGGKVATLVAMKHNDTFTNVDVGYWAAHWDPHGLLHPLYHTHLIGGHWVQVTTLPMLLLGEPLYRLGGYRLTLLLPILGAVACAYAARALARLFGADRTRQWWTFWIIGLASPVTIYALDFWEHTIGLALMGWGTVVLLKLLDTDSKRSRCLYAGLAGLAFSAAATMRTEAFLYLGVTALVIAVTVVVRDRRFVPWIPPGLLLVVGTAVPFVGNWLLTRWLIGGGLREERTAGAAEGLGSGIPLRLREGLVTTFGMASDSSNRAILVGVLAAALIGFTVARSRKRRGLDTPAIIALGSCVGLLYLITFLNGLDFVSGIAGAAPLAVAGAVVVWRPPASATARTAVTAALVTIPLVWAFQWTGGAGAQWGGRYMLCSMLVLVTAGVTALPSLRKPLPGMLVGLSVAVTVFGLVWLSVRTHDVDRLFTTLNARTEPVLVADIGLQFVPREGGATYGDHRWLTSSDAATRTDASDVVRDAGFSEFALVGVEPTDPPPRIGDFQRAGTDTVPWFSGVTMAVTTYQLDN